MNTPTNDLFDPRRPLSAEAWDRYLAGGSGVAAQHDVQLHIEADPLLRDAEEGLRTPEARLAARALAKQGPAAGGARWRGWVAGGAVVLAVAWWAITRDHAREAPAVAGANAPVALAPVTPEEHRVFEQEMAAAHPAPIPVRTSAPQAAEPFQAPPVVAPIARPDRADTAPMQVLPTPLKPKDTTVVRTPGTLRHHSTHRVIYYHDLKTVDPAELFGAEIAARLVSPGVEARYADPNDVHAPAEGQRVPYARFLDGALGKYAAGDRRGCLEDLFVLLDQHPDDLNALFYGGLCAYELGLYPRAQAYFGQVRIHPVDSFQEEGEWYQAMTLRAMQRTGEADVLLHAIADGHGFYADRAQAMLVP